ncbi:hypothetical protein Taro_018878 [Colocasia esculenta]|uniref:Uncharacterized protein n=1 Tax=Colocasia esculenta TaxID=4460 RepID=A0A843UXJ8_COLES|nr:hypothetical protein [Colocasia esculenta]
MGVLSWLCPSNLCNLWERRDMEGIYRRGDLMGSEKPKRWFKPKKACVLRLFSFLCDGEEPAKGWARSLAAKAPAPVRRRLHLLLRLPPSPTLSRIRIEVRGGQQMKFATDTVVALKVASRRVNQSRL